MGSFADSVLANIATMKKEVNDQIVDTFIYAAKQTIQYSPSPSNNISDWATGHLIDQWYPAHNSYSSELTTSKSDTGTNSMVRVDGFKGKNFFLKTDGELTLTNNVDYAVLADRDGWVATKEHPNWQGKEAYYMVDLGIKDAKAKVG